MTASLPSSQICLTPRYQGAGGPASFQDRLADGLRNQGVGVTFDLEGGRYDAVLVVGGTRRLSALQQARRRGARIVQRLDGMNWIHRRRWTGVRHFIRAEAANWLLRLVRARLADEIVYQSRFARAWWEQTRGPAAIPARVIYNAVDLEQFSPNGEGQRPDDRLRLLVVEGRLEGGYDLGLEHAVAFAGHLAALAESSLGAPLELMVAGETASKSRMRLEAGSAVPVRWMGTVARQAIPALDRSAHLLYAADLNPACPNTVIEAMACGLPVAALDTGALPELIRGDAGRLAPYGGDPWRLDPPDLAGLARAAVDILEHQPRFRQGARARAEQAFDLKTMVEGYQSALLEG
jgi:glycosyltransferase involved in cell wall biosynthesis